jgi:hypothetical protein
MEGDERKNKKLLNDDQAWCGKLFLLCWLGAKLPLFSCVICEDRLGGSSFCRVAGDRRLRLDSSLHTVVWLMVIVGQHHSYQADNA